MRVPLAVDVLLLARALMSHPQDQRITVAEGLIRDAATAHRYFNTTQRCHPSLGDGSLMSLVLKRSPVAEPVASDPDFLNSLQSATVALQVHFGTRSGASQL